MATTLLAGCARAASTTSKKSPDGTMTLTTTIDQDKSDPSRYLCVIVDIADAAGKTLHHEVTPASDAQRWSIEWKSNTDVLLKSADVGNYHIRRQPDGTWKSQLGNK
ncbi:MAG: hypothetical protein ACTHN5_04875 [Phycisphaerae bacterium]